jgi:hypothetical protein
MPGTSELETCAQPALVEAVLAHVNANGLLSPAAHESFRRDVLDRAETTADGKVVTSDLMQAWTASHPEYVATPSQVMAWWTVSAPRILAMSPPAARGRSPRRCRRSRGAGTVTRRGRNVDRSSEDPPRRCTCGCGAAVPAGRRKYASDACENRAAQRRWPDYRGFSQWARLDSNQGPTDYESAALTS